MKRLWRILEVLAWAAFFTLAAALLVLRYVLLPQIERYRRKSSRKLPPPWGSR